MYEQYQEAVMAANIRLGLWLLFLVPLCLFLLRLALSIPTFLNHMKTQTALLAEIAKQLKVDESKVDSIQQDYNNDTIM